MTSAALRLARRELGSAIAAAWDFRTGRLPNGLTFSRASGGTRINASGVLELVGNNVPRFAHDPVTFAPLGLLIEPQRTNLALWSEDFANAVWQTVQGVSKVGALPGVGPNGSAATEVSFGALPAAALFQVVAQTTQSYAASFFVKAKAGSTSVRVGLWNGATDAFSGNIAVNSETWTRISLVATGAVSGTSNFSLRNNSSGTSSNVLVACAQLEVGTESTSYIPTSGAAATRAADDLRDPSGISLQAGSILYEVINQSLGGSSPIEVGFGTGSAMYFGPGSVGAPQHFNGISVLLGNNFAVRPVRKMGIAWDAAGRRISGNGGNTVSDTGSVAQVAVPELRFGAYVNGTQPSVICLQRVVKYARGLSAAELQALTR